MLFNLKFTTLQPTNKKTPEEIDFYDYYGYLEKFGFELEDTGLNFKCNVKFSSDKKKLIKKMMMGKDTTQKLFIDESRIWNFSSEKIEAANVTSYIFNYMSDENLIKEFWKISFST